MGKQGKQLGQTKDITFSWVTEIDPELEQWRSLAEEWLVTILRAKGEAIKAVAKFLNEYIHKHNLSKVPSEFLSRSYSTISLYESCYSYRKSMNHVCTNMRHVENFLNWVLENYFSVEDDMGNKIVPIEFHNPITADVPNRPRSSGLTESDKNTLPYLYIKQLRRMLVPADAHHFEDISWAIKLLTKHLMEVIGLLWITLSLTKTTLIVFGLKEQRQSTNKTKRDSLKLSMSCGRLFGL